MYILVINCGSSSIKTSLFDTDVSILSLAVEKIGQPDATLIRDGDTTNISAPDHETALAHICDNLPNPISISAVGHRIVHGGEHFIEAVEVTPDIEKTIGDLSAFAPLHNPHHLTGIRAAQKRFPQATHVAVFDTAFHQSMPEHAYRYALPNVYYERDRIRRYGFHGTSHRYVSQRASQILGKPFHGITCHLGNGCSITAIQNGQSIDTSMGFTPLEGVAMGTRSGDLDPAVVLNLARQLGIDQTEQILNSQSGLLGLSEHTNDVRELQQSDDPKSILALKIFTYRVRKYIGSYLTVLNPTDAIVFTGGIGENSPVMRAQILADLENLGIIIDTKRNENCEGKEICISTEGSPIKVFVIATDEERVIAQETHQITKAK